MLLSSGDEGRSNGIPTTTFASAKSVEVLRRRRIFPTLRGAPGSFGGAAKNVDPSGEDEEQIGESIEIHNGIGADRFRERKADDVAFGPSANSSGEMHERSRLVTAGEDEIPERLQMPVNLIDVLFEAMGITRLDSLNGGGDDIGRSRKVGAESKQVGLDFGENLVDFAGSVKRSADTNDAVQFIDGSVGFDADIGFGNVAPAKKRGTSGIPFPGVNLHSYGLQTLRRVTVPLLPEAMPLPSGLRTIPRKL